jgi:predicted ATPase
MQSTITAISSLLKNNKLEPYLRYIRFPYYKNLKSGLRIEFDFPLTILVGQNGCNKTSVLRAIWACPGNNSIGRFWYSTAVDPIDETGDRPRFIYGYIQPEANELVEIIKTRISKVDKTSNKRDPDYWEPSRPIAQDGMKPMKTIPRGTPLPPGRLHTRWKLMKKTVVYLDFRSEISAYDKYFYHGDLNKTLNHPSKQHFIRDRTKYLKKAIEEDLKTLRIFKGQKEHIFDNTLIPDDDVRQISEILGRNYESVRLIRHRFFKNEGYSILIKSNDISYSEAFAGSGEFAVVKLVSTINAAPDNSLIILDEPEVSLHPGAQKRLLSFLLNSIKIHKHQIIIGTHSPFLAHGLPDIAIKTLYLDPSSKRIDALPRTLPDEAFWHLQMELNRTRIIVEDRLAEEIVRKALRTLGPAMLDKFHIEKVPGGEATIMNNFLPAFSETQNKNILVILDGDKRPENPCPDPDTIPESNNKSLDEMIKQVTGGTSKISFPIDGGANGGNKAQLIQAKRRYLAYVRNHVTYLPGTAIPEDFVWKNMTNRENSDGLDDLNPKKRFEELTKRELGLLDSEKADSDNIFATIRRRLSTIPNDDEGILGLATLLRRFAEKQSIL